jgi:DNA processing protein
MMNQSVQSRVLVTLHETPGIGWRTIRKAADAGDWSAYPGYRPDEWMAIGFSSDQARAAAEAFGSGAVGRTDETCRRLGIRRITRFDDEYPRLLGEIPQPPWVLYAIGDTALLRRPAIAVVGTRVPTVYGRHTAARLAGELAAIGLTVVSGMAKGIDSLAHEAALAARGGTIAVLGTPVDTVYPKQNAALYRRIAEQGLLLSEYPPGTPTHPGLFPQRNRIIAGLSAGTLVVEAAKNSGSLITADMALDMGRGIYAVPGPVHSPKSEGTNGLIRDGRALLVGNASDIVVDCAVLIAAYDDDEQPLIRTRRTEETKPDRPSSRDGRLADGERHVLRLLREKARSANELHALTGYPFGLLHAILINLTIKHKIQLQPGSLYTSHCHSGSREEDA